MVVAERDEAAVLAELEPVRCLACGRVYAPGEQGSPGDASACPDCGDQGWLATNIPLARSGT